MTDAMANENGGESSKNIINLRGSSKNLIDFGSSKHSRSDDVSTDETAAVTPENLVSPSSESSVGSSDVGKDNPANPLLTSKQADLEPQVPVFSQEVSVPNPDLSMPPLSPINTVGHPEGYDPNRIPSSIFSTKPANATEWSTASNESLFSIHMGNYSFSRDHIFMLYKSGEIPRYDETMANAPPPSPPGLSPAFQAENNDSKSENIMESKMSEEGFIDNTKMESKQSLHVINDVSKETDNNNTCKEKMPSVEEIRNSSSSTSSFQFPQLLDCDVGRTSSLKDFVEKKPSEKHLQQEPKPEAEAEAEAEQQTPEATPKGAVAGNSWLSCFSCCTFCR